MNPKLRILIVDDDRRMTRTWPTSCAWPGMNRWRPVPARMHSKRSAHKRLTVS